MLAQGLKELQQAEISEAVSSAIARYLFRGSANTTQGSNNSNSSIFKENEVASDGNFIMSWQSWNKKYVST